MQNDVIDEPTETFTLTGTGAAIDNGPVVGTASILDNSPPPNIRINDVTVNEDAGTAVFTVSLSNVSGNTVTVDYAATDGSATSPGDYTLANGTLTFIPGVTTQTITVNITDDAVSEPIENYTINLSNATNGTITDAVGLGTIIDEDGSDDFAIVHESQLAEGSGKNETQFDANPEAGQGINEGTRFATGNLLANDGGAATNIISIDGVTDASDGSTDGFITLNGTYGTLVVTAATGDYSYTLTSNADNSAPADDDSVLESFTYTSNTGSSDLNITVVDDTPNAVSFRTEAPEVAGQSYNLNLILDVSGSMTGAQFDGVVYLPGGGTTTRLAMAKDALVALVTE